MSFLLSQSQYKAISFYERANCKQLTAKLRLCKQSTLIFVDKSTEEILTVPASCNSQFCPACNSRRSKHIQNEIEALIQKYGSRNLRFLTFTQKSKENEPLIKAAFRFRKALNRLRARKWWRDRIKGYFLKHEVTCNENAGTWHFHCHFLILSGHINRDELRKEWAAASRGSYVIDVRQITPGTPAELSKYVTKIQRVADEKVPELVEFLEEHRMFSFGGLFADCRADLLPPDVKKDCYFLETLSGFVSHLDIYAPTQTQFKISIYLLTRRRDYPDLSDFLLDDLKLFVYMAYTKTPNYLTYTPSPIQDELNLYFK